MTKSKRHPERYSVKDLRRSSGQDPSRRTALDDKAWYPSTLVIKSLDIGHLLVIGIWSLRLPALVIGIWSLWFKRLVIAA